MRVTALEPLSPDAPDPDSGSWIRKTPGVCDGDACIRNTRIPIWLLEGWRRLGVSEERILAKYPGLTSDDIAVAREYVDAHRAEIEEAIRENDEA